MAQSWQKQQKSTYDFYALTNKNLYLVVEKIAEKEIEKNAIDFIKRESFQVGGTEEFYSFNGEDAENEVGGKIDEEDDEDSPNDDEEEEEYEDNEYHEEEKAVAGRLNPYSVVDEQNVI